MVGEGHHGGYGKGMREWHCVYPGYDATRLKGMTHGFGPMKGGMGGKFVKKTMKKALKEKIR